MKQRVMFYVCLKRYLYFNKKKASGQFDFFGGCGNVGCLVLNLGERNFLILRRGKVKKYFCRLFAKEVKKMAEFVFKVKLNKDCLSGGESHFFESPVLVERSLESFLFQGRPFISNVEVKGDPLERIFDYRVFVEMTLGSQFGWEDCYNLLARFFSSRAVIS